MANSGRVHGLLTSDQPRNRMGQVYQATDTMLNRQASHGD